MTEFCLGCGREITKKCPCGRPDCRYCYGCYLNFEGEWE